MTSSLQITWNMTDGTTLQQTFGPYSTTGAAVTNFKASVMALNENAKDTRTTDGNHVRDGLKCIVNADGATVNSDAAIASAVIITKNIVNIF